MKNGLMNGKILAGVLVMVALGFGGVFAVKRYQLNQMTETDLFSMGQVVANRGDCAKALDYYQTLLSKDPRHTVAMDFMASCQIRLKDVRGAIATLEKRTTLEPQPKPLSLLADLYEQAGQKDRAEILRAKVKTLVFQHDVQAQAAAQAMRAQQVQQAAQAHGGGGSSHAPASKTVAPHPAGSAQSAKQ